MKFLFVYSAGESLILQNLLTFLAGLPTKPKNNVFPGIRKPTGDWEFKSLMLIDSKDAKQTLAGYGLSPIGLKTPAILHRSENRLEVIFGLGEKFGADTAFEFIRRRVDVIE